MSIRFVSVHHYLPDGTAWAAASQHAEGWERLAGFLQKLPKRDIAPASGPGGRRRGQLLNEATASRQVLPQMPRSHY
jgi:hypothetical protein